MTAWEEKLEKFSFYQKNTKGQGKFLLFSQKRTAEAVRFFMDPVRTGRPDRKSHLEHAPLTVEIIIVGPAFVETPVFIGYIPERFFRQRTQLFTDAAQSDRAGHGADDDFLFDDEFKDEYDMGDIDMEGFQDLSFEDGTMF